MQALRIFIERYITLSDTDWGQICACFQQRVIAKDELLLKEGKLCKHLYFVETGLLRYFIEKDGQEITKFFTIAPYCFTSQMSFTKELPATDNIQAIEKCILWQITLQQATELLEIKPWNTFIRKLIQEVQFFTESILQEIQTQTAEERYLTMLTKQNNLVARVPLKYLASYLGIAPQSLSRIRKRLM